jgi:hypothetical protein
MGKRTVTLLVLAAAALVALYVGSPFVGVGRARAAIESRDPDVISEYVDVPAVRESLRTELLAVMAKKTNGAANPGENPFAALGQALAANMAGMYVDTMLTPDGLATLIQGAAGPAADAAALPPARTFDEQMLRTAKLNCAEDLLEEMKKDPKLTFDQQYERVAKARCPVVSTWRYKSLDTFVVEYPAKPPRSPVAFVFHRSGLIKWKLSAVRLAVPEA